MRFRATLFSIFFLLSFPPVSYGGDSVSEYWSRPPEIKGKRSMSMGYYPENCSMCHKDQYEDWKGSLHSKSVGAGLMSQLDIKRNPGVALSCYYCHAPAVEQNEVIEKGAAYRKNRAYDQRLNLSGVSCSVCHMRNGNVHGPRLSGGEKKNIGGGHTFIQNDFFEKAEFCRACHQMDEGYKINGKLLTNTYNEWKESYYGKNGIPCQSCHMPGKRHLFRGVHDPEMVKGGVNVKVSMEGKSAALKITNAGVGHYFPTYVTPLVVLKGFLLNRDGKVLDGTVKEAFIGRKVTLDLSEELFDTRIPPFGTFYFNYDVHNKDGADKLVFEVWVYPDEFYNRFFSNAIQTENGYTDRENLKKALKATKAAHYLLYREELFL